LTRREGHWYLTRTLADTDALLRQMDKAALEQPAPQANVAAGQAVVTGTPSSEP